MADTDVIEVFALKKPLWAGVFGGVLGAFVTKHKIIVHCLINSYVIIFSQNVKNIIHDGLGFRNQRTGLNYTMEWSGLDHLLNCTFPHLQSDNSLTWCNQGALCAVDGIDDFSWLEYGTIDKVSEINGSIFNQFALWANRDNQTGVYYATWSVYNTADENDSNKVMYFDSFDSATWTLRFLH
jgi:ceroid-lipofuscinosis neuronal protein 5